MRSLGLGVKLKFERKTIKDNRGIWPIVRPVDPCLSRQQDTQVCGRIGAALELSMFPS